MEIFVKWQMCVYVYGEKGIFNHQWDWAIEFMYREVFFVEYQWRSKSHRNSRLSYIDNTSRTFWYGGE